MYKGVRIPSAPDTYDQRAMDEIIFAIRNALTQVYNARSNTGTDTTDDLIIDLDSRGLVLKDTQSPPHYWRITINTSGALVSTDLGTSKPRT
jgi:hypothetical protein